MSIKRRRIYNEKNFYKDFSPMSPSLLLGLIIISLGLYIINWVYLRNKEFELLDQFAPDSKRGVIIMMIIPFTWFFILYLLKYIFLDSINLFFQIIQIVSWGLIIVLVLKYLLDFCLTYGRITNTLGLVWFIPFLLGSIGILGIIFNNVYIGLLIVPFVIILPAMQSELNQYYVRMQIKKEKDTFYD